MNRTPVTSSQGGKTPIDEEMPLPVQSVQQSQTQMRMAAEVPSNVIERNIKWQMQKEKKK